MAVNYTFPTNTNPSSAFFNANNTGVSSNGTDWVLASGVGCNLRTSYKFPIDTANDLEFQITMNIPNTWSSLNGCWVGTSGDSDYLGVMTILGAYSGQGYMIRKRVGGAETVISTGRPAGTDITCKFIIKKDGSAEVYINGSSTPAQTCPAGTFLNKSVGIGINKYQTDTTGYVRSGYLKTPINSGGGANFMTFFNQYL